MSYVRWSSVVHEEMPHAEERFLLTNGVTASQMQKIRARRARARESNWYIFVHCTGRLACWHVASPDTPQLTCDEVGELFRTKDYYRYFGTPVDQIGVLESGLRYFLRGCTYDLK